jgi:LPS export ABC transporter protein LptC
MNPPLSSALRASGPAPAIDGMFKYFKPMSKVALLLLSALFAFVSCSSRDKEPKATGPVKELPLSEYKDTTILDMYEGSRLSWILKTLHLVKWPKSDLVRAKPVDLTVYDSLNKVAVRVTSDSGSVDEAISFLAASGHVHGHSMKGVDITTDSLRWNKAINQISTDARVRVISEDGDVVTGRGFVSDAKLDNWQILSEVKGVFQKVDERIQKSDSAPAPTPPVNKKDSAVSANASAVSANAAVPSPSAPPTPPPANPEKPPGTP